MKNVRLHDICSSHCPKKPGLVGLWLCCAQVLASGCWREGRVTPLRQSRAPVKVGASPRQMRGVNRYFLGFVCLVFIEVVHKEAFLTQIFCVHYLAIFLPSVKFTIISLVLCVSRLPEAQQRVGGCFLNLMPQMKTLYLAYCANHPSAVNVLTEHRCAHSGILHGNERTSWALQKSSFLSIVHEVQC